MLSLREGVDRNGKVHLKTALFLNMKDLQPRRLA